MSKVDRTSDEKAVLRAKANAAVGLLEAAMKLITTAHSEGPRGYYEPVVAHDTVEINRAIMRLQQKLLRLHDENPE